MSVKDEVLHMLEANKGSYFSGATLAKELNVSRNSIWKAIKSLENEGYKISATTNKGYCLEQSNDNFKCFFPMKWFVFIKMKV